MVSRRRRSAWLLASSLAGCTAAGDGTALVRDTTGTTRPAAAVEAPAPGPPPATAAVVPPPAAGPTAAATTGAPGTTAPPPPAVVDVPYRIEIRSADPAVADFAARVRATLDDRRGWARARFRMEERPDAPYLIVLAEPDEAHRLCLPYDVARRYSCQNGPVVVVNADRWRTATPKWTGDLASYRQMLVNHEVGHLLGMRHPRPQCPATGRPAPVMAQQSTELDGCLPNPWPLPEEVERAARHDLPLAPPPD